MQYARVHEAKDKPGLRLALTMKVPGPWSQSAKYVFQVKNIPFVPVGQLGGRANDELFAWTGHRNAPVAVYNDEVPRTGWQEIIMLAERLQPEPALLPAQPAERDAVFEIISELAAERGLAWMRRLQMIEDMSAPAVDPRMQKVGDTLDDRYGKRPGGDDAVTQRCLDILEMLAAKLHGQKALGSEYFVGEGFTAADLYWACFSQLVRPLEEAVNPMPDFMRTVYMAREPVLAAVDPILIEHRDMIYQRHLGLPLEF